ncbi:MAG: hypothetical protein H7293_01195 [Candidatus Saccharibacteria bacterium]|nr:hypothetical protein [Rhodoferax sp.]
MPITIAGAQAAVVQLNRAFNDISPYNLVFVNQVNDAGSSAESVWAFAVKFGSSFRTLSDAALAHKVLTNMGLLPNTELALGLTDYFAANQSARGIVVLQLSQILLDLEFATGSMALYATAALAWNKEIQDAYDYSTNPTSVFPGTPIDTPGLSDAAGLAAVEALQVARNATDSASETAASLSAAATQRDIAKIKADATDAVDLAGTGSTEAATAATLDDLALAKAIEAFAAARVSANVQVAEAKLAADTAILKANAFVTFATSTLTTLADDTVAATLLSSATAQLVKANAIATTVQLLLGTDSAALQAHGVYPAQPTAIALMGIADFSVPDLLSI